jgi:shikimate dehydrogenase
MITSMTKVCGLIGDPVAHSVSPAMHNAAFECLKLDYIYLPFRVKNEHLKKAIEGAQSLSIRGLNVTIPHKVDIIPLLNELDPPTERIGAVNTIVNDKGNLKGYNTDASGFMEALLQGGFKPQNKKAVVLGAGGASRAVCFALAESGAEVIILNRQQEMHWAVGLAVSVSELCQRQVNALELIEDNLRASLEDAELLVNATSVGMSPDAGQTPVGKKLLKPGMVVFDVVFNPLKTRLLAEAEEAGAKTISGIDMLVWQGALAFKLWTGLKPPVEIMKAAALKALKEQ